ncbi:MAG TPA: helicase-related protein, partial [Gemmataceae bacterium]
MPLLPAHPWRTSYRHEDGDLVALFYVPALSCAVQYDRLTGYFSASALALAARGIEQLIRNQGQMRLIVGCTLRAEEVAAIERGYDFRQQVADHLARISLTPPDLAARKGLETLAWLIGAGLLDVKVAVPVGPNGRPSPDSGIYHEKVGIITDGEGNRLGFSGSINETAHGWRHNRESFHVHCSWESGRDAQHVLDEVESFARLWGDQAASTKVFEFPEAAKNKLLAFLPGSVEDVTLRIEEATDGTNRPDNSTSSVTEAEKVLPLTVDERRRIVWRYIQLAPRLANGVRVGEVTSTVQPWPHQLRTFKRMLDSWPCRLLLSDEVGLGKTISAGLLIRQAWLAGMARRILILAPKAILIQWQNELYEKFNLNVPIYDGQRLTWRPAYGRLGPLDRAVERDEWHKEPFVLCSSQLMRRRDRSRELLQAEPWDLLILDEAHHARRKSPGTPQEGGPNALLRLMQELKDRCLSLLLLTATPMQVHPVEVWDLLNLLGLPPRWAASSANFVHYFQLASGNPSQVEMEFLAEMFRDVEGTFGPVEEALLSQLVPNSTRIGRERILKALREKVGIPLKRLSAAERLIALDILRRFSPIRYRMVRHTRSLLRFYHSEGLLQTPIATRDVRDRPIDMTVNERALYEAIEDYISTTYNNAAGGQKTAIGFVMTVYQRRLASSFYALQRTLTKHYQQIVGEAAPPLIEDEDLSQDETAEEMQDSESAAELTQEALVAQERQSILDLLRQIARLGGVDSKARQLKVELEAAFADGYESAIVFTQYADTMDYLKEYLAVELPGVPIACYSGSGGQRRDVGGFWTPCTKEQIKLAFKTGSVRLLVCTDAAGEGLNFQFCGVLVNYDLPWNPMKVEQRIGRIDRIGQRYAKVRVVNLAYNDTVEADVYFSLGNRINWFEGVIGKLQPILSRLPKEFERVTLERKENREAARQRLLADVGRMAEDAQATAFDIDEAARESLAMPEFPPPALSLTELDTVLNRVDLRPAWLDWSRLDVGSYSAQMPGMSEPLRVTTSAEVFDDHADSHVFLSPGGEWFDKLRPEAGELKDGEG